MKKITLIILAGILTLAAVNLLAQGFDDRDRDRFKFRERIHEQLNLTEEQESKLQDLKFKHQSEMIDLKAELEKEELAQQELKSKGNYTREEFLAGIDELIKIKNKIEIARANHQMDVYEILDSAQKETWNRISDRLHEMKRDFKFHHKEPNFN